MIFDRYKFQLEEESQDKWEIHKKLPTHGPNTYKPADRPARQPVREAYAAHAYAHDHPLMGLDLNGLDPFEDQLDSKAQDEAHRGQKNRPKPKRAKTQAHKTCHQRPTQRELGRANP